MQPRSKVKALRQNASLLSIRVLHSRRGKTMRNTRTLRVAVGALALILGGCKTPYPIESTPVDDSDPQGTQAGVFFTHYVSYTWNGTDLASLEKLTVSHPTSIQVVGASGTQELTLTAKLDIQSQNHEALAADYRDDSRNQSLPHSPQAEIVMPARDCVETRDAQNQITTLQGVCVRTLVITVPPTSLVELELSFRNSFSAQGGQAPQLTIHIPCATGDAAQINLSQWQGAVSMDGGNDATQITAQNITSLNQLWQGFATDLNSAQFMHLSLLANEVDLALKNYDHADVTLDGLSIDKFPYVRN
jgi:hypothetical protein